MNRLHTGWDGRTAEQWLDEAGRFDKMAERFGHHPALNATFASLARNARTRADDTAVSVASSEEYDWSRIRRTQMKSLSASDLDYFRTRAAREQAASTGAHDMRVRQVHLEMAERYRALIRAGEASRRSGLHLVS
jgi:hypothetical protein